MARRHFKRKLRRMNNVARINLYFILAAILLIALLLAFHYGLTGGRLLNHLRNPDSAPGTRNSFNLPI